MKLAIFILAFYSLLLNSTYAQEVDLLWQGETYTPPFYQGRTLWSNQSRITFLAIPQGLGNPNNLNYKWTKNGIVLGNINGIGRNSFFFYDSILSKPQSVMVEILSEQGAVLASASNIVTPTLPELVVYENNPLYGFMFHREINGEYQFQDKETTFTAFPLFFSTLNRLDPMIDYQWQTNNTGVETKNSVTYRTPENTSGSSEIRVRVSNRDKITQDASKRFLVKFGDLNSI